MTLEFFDREEARIQAAMENTELDDEKYMDLFYALQSLCECAIEFIDARERLAFYEENADETSNAPMNIVPMTPVSDPEPEPGPEPEPEEPVITFDELKTRFTKAARSGVKVGEIIEDLGFTKLSDAPPERYADLLKALEEKAGVT